MIEYGSDIYTLGNKFSSCAAGRSGKNNCLFAVVCGKFAALFLCLILDFLVP